VYYANQRDIQGLQTAQITSQATAPYRAVGAVGSVAPRAKTGVTTLMYVGHDGLGGLGPDLAATSRTVGFAAAALWAYARFVSKDDQLQKKAMFVALGGFAGSFLL
jgi:hypothetical protein